MSSYCEFDIKPEDMGEYDIERKPFAAPYVPAPDRTGQLWWRGPMDLSKNDRSCIFFRVIGPPKLRKVVKIETDILGFEAVTEEYDYVHPIQQIIPTTNRQCGGQWWEGFHCWESERHQDGYTRIYED